MNVDFIYEIGTSKRLFDDQYRHEWDKSVKSLFMKDKQIGIQSIFYMINHEMANTIFKIWLNIVVIFLFWNLLWHNCRILWG